MSNKVKAMSHSIIDVGGKIGLGGVSGRYKGTASTLWKIGGCLIGIGVIEIHEKCTATFIRGMLVVQRNTLVGECFT